MQLVISLVLALQTAGSLGASGPSKTTGNNDLPHADEIIELALAAAEQQKEQNIEASYRFLSLRKSEELDKEGKTKKVETRLFQNVPYRGHSYERLIEIDGRPLDRDEAREEEKREREFAEKVDQGNPPLGSEEERMAFDEELVSRYDFETKGLEKLEDRWTYAVAFTPKDGKLPVRRRIDRALNRSSGTIWFDRETYSITRLEFELNDKMRIWWGIIGSISQMRGNLEFQPIEGDIWMPSEFEFYINGRIFFRSLHRKQILRWTDFERIDSSTE
jgi:hypothetical protein